MNVEEVSRIIKSHTGVDTRIQGDEILVQRCLSCGNTRWNLQVNPSKGVFSCWACSFSGHVNEFLDKINYKGSKIEVEPRREEKTSRPTNLPHFPSASDYDEAKAYLLSRGLEPHDIIHYDVRYQPWTEEKQEWGWRVIFPLKDYFTGEVVGYQGRSIRDLNPKYKLSHRVTEFVGYRQNNNIHVVTEGIFDAINIHKAGYNVSVLLGTGNVTNWMGWASTVQINPKHKIFILLDGEAVAEAWRLKQLMSQVTSRVWALKLPKDKDPGDLTPNTLKKLIQRADRNAN